MILSLNKLYDKAAEEAPTLNYETHKEVLVLTNFPFIAKLARNELEEDELHTKRNTERFLQLMQKACFAESVLVSELSFQ